MPATRLKYAPSELYEGTRDGLAIERGRAAVQRLGCAQCHRDAFPSIEDLPPGPSLAEVGQRISRNWLHDWLADPAQVRHNANMPALFTPDRAGFAERWIIAGFLSKADKGEAAQDKKGDHRLGRQGFMGLGCFACHPVPDDKEKTANQAGTEGLHPLVGLGDRFTSESLAAFLADPSLRYPDCRMPKIPMPAETPRNIAAYLLLWSKPTDPLLDSLVTEDEFKSVAQRFKLDDEKAIAKALLAEKGCTNCHPGLEKAAAKNVPIKDMEGCLSGKTLPRFHLDAATRQDIRAFLQVAKREKYPSPFEQRQQLLRHAGCMRCHQRDTDQPPPIEAIGRTLWSPFLARMPYQRTPPLTNAGSKYARSYLLESIRNGVKDVRPNWYSYHMPHYGPKANELLRALLEGDGDLPDEPKETPTAPVDPELPTLGPTLVGHEGYSCITCHVWSGQAPGGVEPGSVGPELTTVPQRIRRAWFDRWLDNPARQHPGTPMPAIFRKGQPAQLASILNGDAGKQKDALWSYFSLGKNAPPPKPRPPIPITVPPNDPPLVAQIPIQLPDNSFVESIAVLYGSHDLLVYDLGSLSPRGIYTGARIVRREANWRSFALEGTAAPAIAWESVDRLLGMDKPTATRLLGYDRLPDGVRIRSQGRYASGWVEVHETLRIPEGQRLLHRELHLIPEGKPAIDKSSQHVLPPPQAPASVTLAKTLPSVPPAAGESEGPLLRPGYRAIRYPRPKTATGEDLVMPGALATHPRDGRLFVASMKLGELFVLHDPHDDGTDARFDDFTHGLFQDAYGLHAEDDALYVLHRRNLTRIPFKDSAAKSFERVAVLPHAVANTYDWGYGLVRDKNGGFILSLAPHANQKIVGSGAVLRITPSKEDAQFQEVAFGMRNPFGWCAGPNGDVFFTDNQGDWVATNKLSPVVEGRFYGFPNTAQAQHAKKPMGQTAVWVPYEWARSLNGVAYNASDKFGPFTGQFFIAELMHDGAIIRAHVEKVNGVYQGSCFPFWDKGLIGPLVLAFDPKGRLYVGGITQPGWMGQPDRGALFRIDFTGQVPFEMQSIHVQPHGFRLRFTSPVDPQTARNPASYAIEHYRYEYTGAYGSPELDRTRLAIEHIAVPADGLSVNLTTAPLVKERVYAITGKGLRSVQGEPLVQPTGVYTLHEIPGN